jgi:glucosamine--fructose-6-phosphate aminotransferase (isomerizing)
MEKLSFIGDILEQPDVLPEAVRCYPQSEVSSLVSRIHSGEFSRLILAGHGSSYHALYPAYTHLAELSIPVSLWQTAELLHYGMGQIDTNTIICINSQSGSSVEVQRLIASFDDCCPACIVAFTNYTDSPLGAASNITIPLCAGEEHGVAVKTYLSALSLSILFSIQLNGGDDFDVALEHSHALSHIIGDFLENWDEKLVEYDHLIGNPKHIIIVGRGPSMGSASNSALNQKEAAWFFSEGMNAAEFRHGPLELADENLTLFVMEGDEKTRSFNQSLAKEVKGYGSAVFWIGNHPPDGIQAIPTPEVAEIFQPVADIIPMQLIAQVLAARKDKEAGVFRHIGKVVRVE